MTEVDEMAATGAWLTHVVCPTCKEPVPVECGDVTGSPLDGLIAQAQEAAQRACLASGRRGHGTITLGPYPAIVTLPLSWTPEQIQEFKEAWDSHWEGSSQSSLPRVRWVPGGASLRDLTPLGSVIIEWPPQNGDRLMRGCLTTIYDAVTGNLIPTVTSARIVVDATASDVVTADLTMFADEDGNPVASGKPHIRDGEIITGTFRFYVSAMRVRGEGA